MIENNHYIRTVNIEPNWSRMFQYAEQIVRTGLNKGSGQALVIEMLEYGKHCHEFIQEQITTEQEGKTDETNDQSN